MLAELPTTGWQLLTDYGLYGLAIFGFIFESSCALHAVLYKRDTRATIAWVGIIWLTPLVGAVLYVLFGVNRIQRRAKQLRRSLSYTRTADTSAAVTPLAFQATLGSQHAHWLPLVDLVDKLAEQPLLSGNRIEPLIGGDVAYPAMLAAIAQAQDNITLCSYIFDRDAAGEQFIAALGAAVKRGVDVRILIDDAGSRYTIPTVIGPLRSVGCRVERFMPTLWPRGFAYSNLRTHRKIMVVDGRLGFTGGMNIRAGTWHHLNTKHQLHDLHFRITGPVVAQLQEAWAEDWKFTTSETIEGERWFPALQAQGETFARGIPTGPDEDLGELRSTIIGALGMAQRRISIVVPYFLPDEPLVEALNVAALRGVKVEIFLPLNNNLALVNWACLATLPQVLERGCHVYQVPGLFDHTKLIVVDGLWSLIGSANLDPRSLRLNFEFNVECYDAELGAQLIQLVEQRLLQSQPLTMEMLEQRNLLLKIRDGLARLLTPML